LNDGELLPGKTWASRVLPWLLPLGLIALMLLAWEVWVRVRDTPAWYLPAPSAIWRALIDNWTSIRADAWVTLQEVVVGFGVAVLVAIPVAVAIERFLTIERAVYPIVVATQAIPLVALAPLLLIWFGHGILPKVVMVALISFFPIVVSLVDGLRSADRETLDLLRTMGASGWQRFRLVKVPSALPAFFSGAKIGMAVAVIGAVIGESSGSNAGLGHAISLYGASLKTPLVFACVLVLALMAIGLFGLIALVERMVMPWRRWVVE
jgi:ABC-type nitrate/sulfonate/bicarbonate transport system permease component